MTIVLSTRLDPVGGTFNADDELASETYDQNGNVTSTGGKSFTYDSENHLMSMTASGKAVSMVYDAFGNRVSKTVNGVTTQYLVEDDVNPTGYPQVFDELTNGAVSRTYTYGVQRISQEQVVSNTWTPSFYGYDGGDNVRNLTNNTGTVTDQYEYDAYGNQWTVEGSTPNNMLYRGEEWDPDVSLVYLRARYMNPLTGRFVSRDPESGVITDPKTLHKYLYAEGDPVNGRDPRGREDLEEEGENLSQNQGKEEPAVEETGDTFACFTLWDADRVWCAANSKSLDEYIGCEGVADLNYWRCLNHQPRLPLPGLPVE